MPDDRPAQPRPVRPAGPDASGSTAGFDRQPPQDLAAEQSVLGGMMLSKDAIADVVEVLRPATSTGRRTRPSTSDPGSVRPGEPADAVTVAAELHRRGDCSGSAERRICTR